MLTFQPDQMHGVWVSDLRFKGSYGRIAFNEDQNRYWISWTNNGHGSAKLQKSASLVDDTDLKILPVTPDPWFVKCSHCGEYGLPLGYVNLQKRTICGVT